MRKITLFIALIFSSGLMFGQTVLSEDFEAGTSFPTTSGWTVQDLATPANNEVWTIDNTGEAGGFPANNTLVYVNGGSGNYATMDSDGYGNNGTAENTTLTSPVFDCSSLTSVTLSFDTVYNGNFGGQGVIEVFNGTAWTTLQTYATQAGGTPSTTIAGNQTFDVPQLVGVSNAQIRFVWTGNWSISWSIDNISVFQCTVNVPNAASAIAPADMATNVEITYGNNNTIAFEWTLSTMPEANSYDISLGTTNTGDDIGTLSGFESGNSIIFNWQPNTTYYWKITGINCAGSTESPVFSFTTATCTETSAPTAASVPVPANNAPAVAIDAPDGSVNFSWTGGGNPNETYVLNIGTANPPTQAFDFEIGDPLTGLQVNTTYFWRIDVVTCFGTTEGPVWSFTTNSQLSITENQLDTFSVYPNPTSNILNIKATNEVDKVEVFNLLGQNVANYSKNEIIDSSVNLSDLSEGLYLVKITSGNNSQTIKITKE